MSKMKPLIQSEFSMKIVEDLGNIAHKGKKRSRYAVFECTACKEHFTARATGKAARKQLTCYNCTLKPNGPTKHELYPVWNSIRQRCYNPKRKDYVKYGAKGVRMADEWVNNPQAFIDFCVANGWKKGLVVDKDTKSRELGVFPPIYSPDTLSFLSVQQNAEEANGKKVYQYSLEGDFIAEHTSCVKAAVSLGKKPAFKSAIANCCRGVTKSSLGFLWSYNSPTSP